MKQESFPAARDADLARVDAFMSRLAMELEATVPQDARTLWVRLQVAERQRLDDRARRVRRLSARIAIASIVAISAWLGMDALPQLARWLRSPPAAVYVAAATLVVIHSRIRALRYR